MMKTKFILSLILAFTLLAAQVGTVFAADPPITGMVQSISIEKDPSTGVTTVLVAIMAHGTLQNMRISLTTATSLALVTLDANGNPLINDSALGKIIGFDPATIITAEETLQHPVGSALASFFSEIEGLDYDMIMTAHEDGMGFGVIAQALWLTQKLEGDATVFLEILEAKGTGDYSAFVLEDGTSPQNWGQFKKAILDGEKNGNPGFAISSRNKDKNGANNGNGPGNGNGDLNSNRDKNKNTGNGKNK